MLCLNLGCGVTFHHDWINIDFVSTNPAVMAHDLRRGIPYPENQFDVVYHSHVLEHFTKSDGFRFTNECYRVLKPNGVLRVVVPDLEEIARQYLDSLSEVLTEESPLNAANYDWSVIELIDQMVREWSGGEMAAYWSQHEITNESKVISRCGAEFTRYREGVIRNSNRRNLGGEFGKSCFAHFKQRLKRLIFKLINVGPSVLDTETFRNSGESHKWMYDRYSLCQLLRRQGFRDIKKTTAFTSSIPLWDKYKSLDIEGEQVRKPDSLFIEGVK
jgi:predicted SAM-dependent methyltransferase